MKNTLLKRPVVLSIAGFDPSAGAGVLADVKTFEQLKTYGIAVQTALTVQNDEQFIACEWTSEKTVLQQLEILLVRYSVAAVKIGIVESYESLLNIIQCIKRYNATVPIVWDPILKSSSGFDFHNKNVTCLSECLAQVSVLTPNWVEMKTLFGENYKDRIDEFTRLCAIYLKGGHRSQKKGEDILYCNDILPFVIKPKGKHCTEKHGSGCVFSSALAANLALGFPLLKASVRAKRYTERFLESNKSLLGYHKT